MDKVIYHLRHWLLNYNALWGDVKIIIEFEEKHDYCQAESALKHNWEPEWGAPGPNIKICGVAVEFRTKPTHGN